ncbi:hypothetical protein Fot_19592 [Forsythia ovata]|uniref:Uncharacterized protein n=1 Tax=Forsythia ovata TaxID=205694 RepID=A0ABD1VLH2_9LAMI
MGGVCSGGTVKSSMSAEVEHDKTSRFSGKLKSIGSFGKLKNDNSTTYPDNMDGFEKAPHNLYDSGELNLSISQELKPSTPARKPANKAPQVSSFLGKAGIAGLEKAVEVLDTLGSSMTNLNSGGFTSGVTSRGNKISILAFEVANTIVKGANLLQSLSEENIHFLRKEILHSEGVQKLVSTDMNELLRIAAADKREEFDVFSREVIRFGNLCKDAQFHNLNRFFSKLDSDPDIHKQLREEAKMTIQELTVLAQHTSELYHELHALDRFEQDYRRKVEEVDSLHLPRKGESLVMLQSELKHQRKLVRSLKKKSLWSKSLEEVVEKLVDVVTFIHQDILESFGDNGLTSSGEASTNKPERLGVAGLSLHYANIITQIDNINALRSRFQVIDTEEELTVPQIKAEMEKTLQWLVPIATDTTKAHQGFGWVGEWANAGNEFGKKTGTPNNLIRLQTLYHANKQKADSCILELVAWLHRLVSLVTYRDNGLKAQPGQSPTLKGSNALSSNNNVGMHKVQLSPDDRNLLDKVVKRRNLAPGLSKSQEFTTVNKRKNKVWAFSRSTGSSPRRGLELLKGNVLDILDGLDSTFLAPREDIR